MIVSKQNNLPELFGWLTELGCLGTTEMCSAADGFCVATASVADILAHRGIVTVPGRRGEQLD